MATVKRSPVVFIFILCPGNHACRSDQARPLPSLSKPKDTKSIPRAPPALLIRATKHRFSIVGNNSPPAPLREVTIIFQSPFDLSHADMAHYSIFPFLGWKACLGWLTHRSVRRAKLLLATNSCKNCIYFKVVSYPHVAPSDMVDAASRSFAHHRLLLNAMD